MRTATLTSILATALVAGCGAPTKSAGDVASLFSGDAASLQDKVGSVCNQLAKRDSAPTLKELSLDVDGCGDAGKAAQNYNDITEFQFLGLDGEVPPEDQDKIIKKTVRGQLWINRSLLALASALDAKFRQGNGKTGDIDLGNDDKSLENLVKFDMEAVDPIKFDADTQNIDGSFHITAEGVVKLDNKLKIAGQMLDGAFAATVRTTDDQVVEKSLVKKMEGVIIVAPYAGDVYLDIYFDVEVHNLGFPGLFRNMLGGVMGFGLKAIADLLLSV